ncbi:fasciclin domain-containing protein [Flavobacterium soli]|uniref:fasciclin domain-containing protein n=1 Tax=Flavobacterium soli TaxID=344881 RepID=UPI0003F6F536|nr:fasciclin domain-containing protein [Flavobacterium soli]
MKRLTKFKNLGFIALTALFLTSCDGDADSPADIVDPEQTIVDIAVSNPDFSILVEALTKADLVSTLDGDGPFTVFAPTNAAFNSFLSANGFANLDAVPTPVLKEVLLNHVVSGENLSGSLSTGYVKTLGKGSASTSNTLSMFINTTNGVVLNGGTTNGGATVTTADIEASNGVIHVVNGVIGLPTIVNHAIANPSFGILVQALTRNDQPDFVGILSGTASSPFTVFAPTDDAFVDLLAELELSSLADVPQAVLENTLKYHVVAGANVLSSSLTNNQSVTTFQGGNFTVELPNSGPQIRDANDRISLIIATDVQASNGVVHAIDKVILPGS